MLISDPHRLAFIHNPKCAGTTIWNGLKHLDSYGGKLALRFEHPEAGWLDLAHLALAPLNRYFPDIFEKVCRYESYAIVREPRQRFASAVLYYVVRYLPVPVSQRALPQLQQEALALCARLEAPGGREEIEMAHFQPQTDFVNFAGKRVVRHLYAMEDLPRFAVDLAARHGIAMDVRVLDNARRLDDGVIVKTLKDALRPLYRAAFPHPPRPVAAWTRKSPEPLYRMLLENQKLRAFVDHYYRDDFALYQAVRERRS